MDEGENDGLFGIFDGTISEIPWNLIWGYWKEGIDVEFPHELTTKL